MLLDMFILANELSPQVLALSLTQGEPNGPTTACNSAGESGIVLGRRRRKAAVHSLQPPVGLRLYPAFSNERRLC